MTDEFPDVLDRLVAAHNAHRDNPSGDTYAKLWEAIKEYNDQPEVGLCFWCDEKATTDIDGKPLCDKHAAEAIESTARDE